MLIAALALVRAAAASDLPWPTATAPQVHVEAADTHAASAARALAGPAPRIVELAALRLELRAPPVLTIVVSSRAPRDAAEAAALGVPGAPYWAAGVAQPGRSRIVLFADRLGVAGHEGLEGALAHEASHLVLDGSIPPGATLPRWYDEGLAMVIERDLSWQDALELARMAVFGSPPPLDSLGDHWPTTGAAARAAYAAALSFVSHAQAAARPGAPRRLVEALHAGAPFDRAFAIAYGTDVAALEKDWRRSLRDRYIVLPIVLAGTAANIALGVLATLVVIAARRRRRRALAHWDETWEDPGHDEWRG